MNPDEVCIALLNDKLIDVDPDKGLAFSRRSNRSGPLGFHNQKGYLVCTLCYGKSRKQVKLHRLIWIAVNGPIPGNVVIDHKNRVKDDNRISNLRLVTQSINSHNRRSYKGTDNPAARIDQRIANTIRQDHLSEKSYSKVAKRFGVSRSLVAQIVRGELWRNP